MDFLENLGGNMIAKKAGEKAGDLVEDLVEKAMGGDKKEAAEADKGGAIGQLMNFGGGNNDEEKDSGLANALSFVTGKDDKKDDGGGVMGGLGKLTDMF
ncbi:hypothetical protein JOQ06_028013 [Pogonophryne albipinna]|uniref:Uncharacterized protein n=1 Tax=Pogonophryne albipinna TaxID=1090488 RepID=A0AAD6F7V1_9TELE|nr:hypothetical protein JOQ06_028013 [Pogonophryne albipinna]